MNFLHLNVKVALWSNVLSISPFSMAMASSSIISRITSKYICQIYEDDKIVYVIYNIYRLKNKNKFQGQDGYS